MRVVYFSKTSECGPASRYRIYQFIPFLNAVGIECTVRPLFGRTYFKLLEIQSGLVRTLAKSIYSIARFMARLWDLARLGKPELIVIEGQLFPYCPPWVEQALTRLGYKVVIEFDDAIYLTPWHQRKIPALLQSSGAAIVGNSVLAQYAKPFTQTLVVIPTVVDTERFIPRRFPGTGDRHRGQYPIIIVWIGLAYNFPYLEVLVPALQVIQREFHARFRVVSSRSPSLPGVSVEFVPWELPTEVASLQDCHIGVMPLPDSEWAKGKCGLKLLQYMAIGLTAVASPVGVNQEIITSGENGLLASAAHEWSDHLVRLCRDHDLRSRLGEAGRRTVEARYALKMWGPCLAETYQTIAGQTGLRKVEQLGVQSIKRCA